MFNSYLALFIMLLMLYLFSICDMSSHICVNTFKYDFMYLHAIDKAAESFREILAINTLEFIPSPYSQLVLGITLGIDRLYETPNFKKMLIENGTIHVVVVSGYNIGLVVNMIANLIGGVFSPRKFIITQAFLFLYVILVGFQAPVLRAWVMGSVVLFSKFFGREFQSVEVLIFSACVLVLIWPNFIFDIGFQLSFFATLGIIMYSSYFQRILRIKNIFFEDLATSLSAQIFVAPLISYYFGRFNIFSPFINALSVWTISYATILGSIFLIFTLFSKFFSQLTIVFLSPFLKFFVLANYLLNQKLVFDINYKISILTLFLFLIIGVIFKHD